MTESSLVPPSSQPAAPPVHADGEYADTACWKLEHLHSLLTAMVTTEPPKAQLHKLLWLAIDLAEESLDAVVELDARLNGNVRQARLRVCRCGGDHGAH